MSGIEEIEALKSQLLSLEKYNEALKSELKRQRNAYELIYKELADRNRKDKLGTTTFKCALCGIESPIVESQLRARIRSSKYGELYCSIQCSSRAHSIRYVRSVPRE